MHSFVSANRISDPNVQRIRQTDLLGSLTPVDIWWSLNAHLDSFQLFRWNVTVEQFVIVKS